MRVFIVDTNIVFSTILNPNSSVGEILLNSRDCITFYAPAFLRLELNKHRKKLIRLTGLSDEQLEELKLIALSRIQVINEELIPFRIWRESARILREIDSDDAPFLASSKYLNEYLWTGDKVLHEGLISMGYNKVVYTEEIRKIREELRKK